MKCTGFRPSQGRLFRELRIFGLLAPYLNTIVLRICSYVLDLEKSLPEVEPSCVKVMTKMLKKIQTGESSENYDLGIG